jgi:pyruvate kinase
MSPGRLQNVDRPFEIWATFGPSMKDEEMIRDVIRAGATGIRFNFSYGTPDDQIGRARRVRDAAATIGHRVLAIADIAGEKIRISELAGTEFMDVVHDETVVVGTTAKATGKWLRLSQFGNLRDCAENDEVVIGDGAVALIVQKREDNEIVCRVKTAGRIEKGRGVLLKGNRFSPATLTEKDIADIRAIAATDAFDAIALSFVSSASDIRRTKEELGAAKSSIPIIAKIETSAGLSNLNEIAKAADYLMAARGDLALTNPWPELARHVQRIAEAAQRHDKKWILATQLVEGLEHFALPTRAEMCDLPLWIGLGAAGALLSHETAFGANPAGAVAAVTAMAAQGLEETALDALESGYDTPRQRKLRRQAYWVTAYHIAIVVGVAVATFLVRYPKTHDYQRFAHLIYVLGFGAIGATIHANRYVIFSVAHRKYQRPKLLWQLMTPIHSAVLAAVAYAAGKAGLLTLTAARVGENVTPKEPDFTYFVMASSFLVGFASEVFVKRLATAAEALFGEHGDLQGERKPSENDMPDDLKREDRA